MHRMLEDMDSGPDAWERFEAEVEEARRRFAGLIGALPEQIAVMPNASTCAYQVVSTLRLTSRPKIVVTADEFPSIAHVWLAQRGRGADVVFVDRNPSVLPDTNTVLDEVDERTGLVSVPLVAYESGIRWNAGLIAEIARDHGAVTFVDAYQAAGVCPINVSELQCDFLVAGTHKYLLGLPGCAFLYVRDAELTALEPQLTGWFGRCDPFSFDAHRLDFPPNALRFQTGTPAIPAVYACTAGLGLLAELDLHEVEKHVASLILHLESALDVAAGRVLAPGGHSSQGAHVGIVHPAPAELARWLSRRGILTSPRGELLRVAFHYYNDARDVDRLCESMKEYGDASVRAG